MKQYLSVRQVAQRLNGAMSPKLIYKLIPRGKLRANRSMGKALIEEDSLIELMDGPRAPPPMPEEAAPPTARMCWVPRIVEP